MHWPKNIISFNFSSYTKTILWLELFITSNKQLQITLRLRLLTQETEGKKLYVDMKLQETFCVLVWKL